MKKLTPSQEDYLEAIYNQVVEMGFAKVTDISKNLNVKKASVTGALNSLLAKNLINYTPYSTITLTNDGENLAQKILEKHKVMTAFFIDILGLSSEEAVLNACKMEHIISEELFEKISKLSKYINNSPDIKKQLNELYK